MISVIRRIKMTSIKICLLMLGFLVVFPLGIMLSGSIMSRYELGVYLAPLLNGTGGGIAWKFFPDYPTFEHYVNLLLKTPQFFVMFWNSLKVVVLILAGQLAVGLPAAWTFAVYRFRMRRILFAVYIVLMLMPFQVTMLSGYLVLDKLHLLNTHGAIILPGIFSAFPVFLMYRGFCGIPAEIIEAARIDGAGEWRIFAWIGIPLAFGEILSAMVLGFLDLWGMIEQPMTYLKDKSLWPLSLYLPEIGIKQAGFSFAASVITLIPAVFVFLLGREYLERGIAASALKG